MERQVERNPALLRLPVENILRWLRIEGLPVDATVLNADYNIATNSIVLRIESEEFLPVQGGGQAYCLEAVGEQVTVETLKVTPWKEPFDPADGDALRRKAQAEAPPGSTWHPGTIPGE